MFLLQYLHVSGLERNWNFICHNQSSQMLMIKLQMRRERTLSKLWQRVGWQKLNLGTIRRNVETGVKAEISSSPAMVPWDPTQGDDRQLDGRLHPAVAVSHSKSYIPCNSVGRAAFGCLFSKCCLYVLGSGIWAWNSYYKFIFHIETYQGWTTILWQKLPSAQSAKIMLLSWRLPPPPSSAWLAWSSVEFREKF